MSQKRFIENNQLVLKNIYNDKQNVKKLQQIPKTPEQKPFEPKNFKSLKVNKSPTPSKTHKHKKFLLLSNNAIGGD